MMGEGVACQSGICMKFSEPTGRRDLGGGKLGTREWTRLGGKGVILDRMW